MSDAFAPEPTAKGNFTTTLLAALGGFAIFLLILVVAYLPNQTPPPGDGVRTPEQRKTALIELRGKEQTAATSYGWIDREQGVVRLPLARAKELIIQEHARP